MEQKRLLQILQQVTNIETVDGQIPSATLQAAVIQAVINHDAIIEAAKIQSDAIKLAGSYISQSLDGLQR